MRDQGRGPVTEQEIPMSDHGPTSPNELAIVQIVLGQMTLLEGRLARKMDDNANATRDRWKSHDDQHDEWEKALKAIGHRLDDHLQTEREADLVFDARLSPIRSSLRWAWRERITLMLGIVLAADLLSRVLRIDLV
jgi:hypothetical protein